MSHSAAQHSLGFATTTPIDHRAWLWVAGFLSLIYSLMSLAARLVAKWGLLWYDDAVMAVAYGSALCHWALLFASITHGLGVSNVTLSYEASRTAAVIYFGSWIPLLVSHCIAKLSLLVFTRRIFATDINKENLYFRTAYAFTLLYGFLAILLISAGCHPEEALIARTDAVCAHNTTRWTVLTAFDAATELVVLAMPVWFISQNQLKTSKKRIVIFVYMFRLIIIAITAATTASYFHFLHDGRDNIDIAPVVVWQETLLCFSLISASIPCLRSFIRAFMSRGLMAMYGNTGSTAAGSNSASRNASVQLRSMSKSLQASRKGSDTGDSTRARLRPEHTTYYVDARHDSEDVSRDRGRGTAATSEDSDHMFIHQQTTFRVDSIRM